MARFTNQLTPTTVATAQTRQPRNSGAEQLIGVLDQFVNEAHNTLDAEAVRKARVEGAKAGSKAGFQLSPLETLSAQAFNKAGIETFLNKTKSTTDRELSALLSDPILAQSPVDYEREAQKKVDAMMKDMPLEAIPNYTIYANTKIAELTSKAASNKVKATLETNKAVFAEAESNSFLQISNAAENGDLPALAREQEMYIRTLENQGPLVAGGTGVLTPEAIANRKNDMFRKTRANLVMGAFRRTPTEQKLKFITEFQETNFAEQESKGSGVVASGLSAHEKRKMEDAMFGDLKSELAREARKDAAETKAEGEISDAAMLAFYENPADDKAFDLAKQLNPTKADKVISFRNDHLNGDHDDVINDTFKKLHDGVLTNQWLEDQLGRGISGATYDSFRKKLLNHKVDFPFTSWPSWKDKGGYLDRLETDVPVKTNLFGRAMANDKNAKIAARVRQEVFDTAAVEWKRHQEGALKDPPDVLHIYNRTLKKILSEQQNEAELTPRTVPSKYVKDPALLSRDIEAGLVSTQKGTEWKKELEKINDNN